MPKHGFARLHEWAMESAEEDRVIVEQRKQTDGFPYRYGFRACFTLQENRLSVDYTVTNKDTQTIERYLGGHVPLLHRARLRSSN